MPTPLPRTDAPEVQRLANENPENLSTYNICLNYEQNLTESDLTHSDKQQKLRHVRIIGFLLLHAPNQGVRDEVTRNIRLCQPEDGHDLPDLGGYLQRYFITPFKKYKGRTPKPSEPPSNHDFELVNGEVKIDIAQAPKNHQGTKDRALIRDNWRCVVTGIMDKNAPADVVRLDSPPFAVFTQCAHIFPESISVGVEPKSSENLKFDYSASVLAILERFGYNIASLSGEKIHSLTNVMTLEANVHDAFDRLLLYFEATSQKDHYEVKWYDSWPPPLTRQFITLSTSDPQHLPVTSCELLALHATCCKVAHLSGAAEYIDEIYHDADRLDVLSVDGTSGDILDHMLLLSLLKPLAATVGP